MTPDLDRAFHQVAAFLDMCAEQSGGMPGDFDVRDDARELRGKLLAAYDGQVEHEKLRGAVLAKAELLLLNYVGAPDLEKHKMLCELGAAWNALAGSIEQEPAPNTDRAPGLETSACDP